MEASFNATVPIVLKSLSLFIASRIFLKYSASSRYLNALQILRALKDIKDKYKKKDGRKLGDGLKIAKTDLFDVSGRDEKHKVLFILTDGAAGDTFNEQAQALKDSAVSIYAVGMLNFIF